MTTLTRDQINEIINLTRSHAKVVYDRMYDKITKEIGANDKFKIIIDKIFDDVAEIRLETLNNYFNNYFIISGSTIIGIDKIKEYFDVCNDTDCIVQTARGAGNTFSNAVVITINQSVNQAFIEKIAEYINVDISDILA